MNTNNTINIPHNTLKHMKFKRTLFIVILFIIFIYLTSFLSVQNWFYSSGAFEGNEIKKNVSLENSIFTQKKLDEITTYLKDESETSSMIILENGNVVYEYGDSKKISYIASCRKSVLAILYGKYVDNGVIDLNQTIGDIGIDEDEGLLPIEKKATIDPLLLLPDPEYFTFRPMEVMTKRISKSEVVFYRENILFIIIGISM